MSNPTITDAESAEKWPTSAETSFVAWPISVMAGAEWNLLDSTGVRVADCGHDLDGSARDYDAGVRIARAIVAMIRNLKVKADTLDVVSVERDVLREKCEKQKAALEAVVRESCGRVHCFHCQIKSGGECDCSVGLARDALAGEFVPDHRTEQIRKLREGIEAALGEMPNGLLAKWQRDKVESTLRAALAIGGGA